MVFRYLGATIIAFAAISTAVDAQQQPVDETAVLDLHNGVRRAVNPPANPPLPDLTWSSDLAQSAAAYAARCEFGHSGTPDIGENVFVSSATSLVSPDEVVLNWAAEQTNYDALTNTCAANEVCGHYTQIVWANTDFVGCGAALCDPKIDGEWGQIWVCQYSPRGNVVGQTPYVPVAEPPPIPRPVPMEVFCRHVHKWSVEYTLGPFLDNDSTLCSDPQEGVDLTVAAYCEHLHTWGGNNTSWVEDAGSKKFCADHRSEPTYKVERKVFCEHLHKYVLSNTSWPYYTDDPDAYTGPWVPIEDGFCDPTL